jgi:hypothetical protein
MHDAHDVSLMLDLIASGWYLSEYLLLGIVAETFQFGRKTCSPRIFKMVMGGTCLLRTERKLQVIVAIQEAKTLGGCEVCLSSVTSNDV